MKIKQLFENTNNLPQLGIYVECAQVINVQEESDLDIYRKDINARLSTLGFKNIGVSANHEFFEITAMIPNQSVIKHIENAYDYAIERAEDFDDVNQGTYNIHVDWPPAFPLIFNDACPELVLKLHQKSSIKGIDKLISNVAFISFRNSKNIEGFLNILKIKNLSNIEFSGGILRKVESIIEKHLKGDKNILECHEELVDNGLEEYAQL